MGITEIAAIASVVISAASGAYSGYVSNDNAIDAKNATRKRATLEAERAREAMLRLQGQQRAALASGGVDLTGGGTSDLLLGETARLGQQDLNMIGANMNSQLDFLGGQGAQGIAGAGLGFLNNALGAYSNATNRAGAANLLDQRYGSPASNNMFTGTSNRPLTLLNRG